jgi:hypothetical protein
VTGLGSVFPKEAIAYWPEVFGEVTLTVLPIRYLQTVLVHFKDGKTWEIRVTAYTKRAGIDSLEKSLTEMFNEYKENIREIEFKLDTTRVKKDVEKATLQFLKKTNL